MIKREINPTASESKAKSPRTETVRLQHIESTLELCCITLTRVAGEANHKYSSGEGERESLIQALNKANEDIATHVEPVNLLVFSEAARRNARLIAKAHKDALQMLQLTSSFLDNLGVLEQPSDPDKRTTPILLSCKPCVQS